MENFIATYYLAIICVLIFLAIMSIIGWQSTIWDYNKAIKKCERHEKEYEDLKKERQTLEFKMGVPFYEDDLLVGEQYQVVTPRPVVYFKKVGASDHDCTVRGVYSENLPTEAGKVFTVIQETDGKRKIFVHTSNLQAANIT